jgi:dipeptidyl aminopeptidase/acylaminoacyl peptidase
MNHRLSILLLPLALLACKPGNKPLEEAAIIPREVLFGNPERAAVQLSPDGKYLSWLAPQNGVLNVWVAPSDNPDASKIVTNDSIRGIRSYNWTYKSDNLLYIQDVGGDENWDIYLVNVSTGESKNLTPSEEIPGPDGVPMKLPNGQIMRPTAQIMTVSTKNPNEMLIQMNQDNPQFMDVFRVNLETGDLKKVLADDGFLQIVSDEDLNIRLGTKNNMDGETEVFKFEGGKWHPYFVVPKDDNFTFGIFGTNKSGDLAYMIDSRSRNTGAFVTLNLKTDEIKVIASDEKSDIQNLTQNPITEEIEAVQSNYLKSEWIVLSDKVKKDFDYLKSLEDGDFVISSRTQDDKFWLVAFTSSVGPVKYYKYDRDAKKANYLFNNRPALDQYQLSKMYPVEIPSRDGLKLVSYLTLPSHLDNDGKPNQAIPMVLWVHGGPWARDNFGFNSVHQWLANRGYAVLSVNYRGSTGFGKSFINAAKKEWAGKMHDDLIDAVNWAVENGIAQKDKVAIGGGSYGGYATLVGVTFTPDVFACGVDIVGPSNLNTLLGTIPPYWKAFFETFAQHVGDPRTEEGKALLDERSPLTKVDNIKKPLLIGQGANDPRVKQTESDQIVKAMQEQNIPVTYVLYPDEGHGFARPENRFSFFAVMEQFLSNHLNGRVEPVGNAFDKSSIEIPHGKEFLKGLPQ